MRLLSYRLLSLGEFMARHGIGELAAVPAWIDPYVAQVRCLEGHRPKLRQALRRFVIFLQQKQLIAAPETTKRSETLINGQTPLTGLLVANLSPAVADQVQLPSNATGVVALDVKSGPAQQFFQKGDVLLDVNGQHIDSVETLQKLLGQSPRHWVISFQRGGQKVYLRLG